MQSDDCLVFTGTELTEQEWNDLLKCDEAVIDMTMRCTFAYHWNLTGYTDDIKRKVRGVVMEVMSWNGKDDINEEDHFLLINGDNEYDGFVTFCEFNALWLIGCINEHRISPFQYFYSKWLAWHTANRTPIKVPCAGNSLNEVLDIVIGKANKVLLVSNDRDCNIGVAFHKIFGPTTSFTVDTWCDPWHTEMAVEMGYNTQLCRFYYDQGLYYDKYVTIVDQSVYVKSLTVSRTEIKMTNKVIHI